jgi:hypothetical protein
MQYLRSDKGFTSLDHMKLLEKKMKIHSVYNKANDRDKTG